MFSSHCVFLLSVTTSLFRTSCCDSRLSNDIQMCFSCILWTGFVSLHLFVCSIKDNKRQKKGNWSNWDTSKYLKPKIRWSKLCSKYIQICATKSTNWGKLKPQVTFFSAEVEGNGLKLPFKNIATCLKLVSAGMLNSFRQNDNKICSTQISKRSAAQVIAVIAWRFGPPLNWWSQWQINSFLWHKRPSIRFLV